MAVILTGAAVEIAQDVAAAGCDADEVLAALQLQCLQIDDRVLPDLGIDEPGECKREQALLDASAADRLVPVHSFLQPRLLLLHFTCYLGCRCHL